jgi:hypothetical protein
MPAPGTERDRAPDADDAPVTIAVRASATA